MKNYCTVPMDIVKDEYDSAHYVFCGKEATHAVERSLWLVCEEHANTMERDGRWPLIPIEEVAQDEQGYASRCESIGSLAEGERTINEGQIGECQGSC